MPGGRFNYGNYAAGMTILAVGGLALTTSLGLVGLFGLLSYLGHLFFGVPASLLFANPLLSDASNRPAVAVLFLFLGLGVGGFIFLYSAMEFWRRTRPTKIDDRGVEIDFAGRPVRLLKWSEVQKIIKLRYVHPIGYHGEMVWILGSEAATQEAHNNPWKAIIALWPPTEIWITSSMGLNEFHAARDLVSTTHACTTSPRSYTIIGKRVELY